MGVVGFRNHNQAGAVRQLLVVGRHRMFERMFARAAPHAHHRTRKGIAPRYTGAGLEVAAVGHGTRQVAGHILNSVEHVHVAHQIGGIGDIGLGRMKQRIEPLESREFRRNGKHQLRIDDGEHWKQPRMYEARLFVGFGIGNHAPRIGFGTCTGRGGDRHDRQRRLGNCLALTRSTRNIIPIISAVGRNDRNSLRSVHHAAAAQSDDHIASVFTSHGTSRHNGRF